MTFLIILYKVEGLDIHIRIIAHLFHLHWSINYFFWIVHILKNAHLLYREERVILFPPWE